MVYNSEVMKVGWIQLLWLLRLEISIVIFREAPVTLAILDFSVIQADEEHMDWTHDAHRRRQTAPTTEASATFFF